MRFFIYSRKSVYTGKGESIENQIEMCRQYIREKFPGAADGDMDIYEDEGFSARNTDRPQFQQMLRDIRAWKPDFVVCYRLDRISRSVSDFSALIEELNDRDISFVCIREEFDTSKPMGKAMMYIASVFAQLERETIAERVRDNMLMLARTGRWLGGTTPMGYTSEKVREIVIDGKVKTSCRLKDNAEELRVVDTIFEKFLELRSVSGVSRYLIRQGVKSRSGTDYSLPGIKEILQNPVYCTADRDALDYFSARGSDVCFDERECSGEFGLLAYNKRDYKKKHAPRQTMDKWIIAIGKHRGRVSGKKWAAVQNIIEDNIPTGKKPAKMHNDYSLLSGLIWCDRCGRRMFAKRRWGTDRDDVRFDYICSGKLRGGTASCGCRNLNGRQADALVCEALMQYTDEDPGIYPLLEKLRREIQEQAREEPLEQVEARMRACSAEMDRLVSSLAQGELTPAFVRRVNIRVGELDRELSELSRTREALREEADCPDRQTQSNTLAASLSSLKDGFHLLSIHEKRVLIKLLVKQIRWDGENLHLFTDG